MTDALTQTTAASLSLVTREDCINAAQNALRDYKATMLCVTEHWCKPESEGGLGLPIEELAEELGKAPRTLKEYRTELYKLGRLEKTETRGRVAGSKVLSGIPDKKSQPTTTPTTINDQPTELPVCPPLLSVVPDLEPQPEASLAEVNGVPMGTDQQRSLAEHWHNVEHSDAPDSYKQAQFLLSQLDVLLSGARRDGWSERHYAALFQDLESYAKSCEAASRDYRNRVEAECEARFAGTISRIDGGVALPC